MSTAASPTFPRGADVNPKPLGAALLLIIVGAWYLAQTVGAKHAALFVVGALLGLALYHAAFGFTSAWRVFIADGRGAALRAQMMMLAVASILFFPVLAQGTLFGLKLNSAVEPVGLSVIVGAFLFGLGMQLGGGCASGTLYTVGGGSTRMVVTLFFFVVGSVAGAYQLPWWEHQWNVGRVSLIREFGWARALAL